MFAEFLEYLFTPCPRLARRMGYLTEAVAIRARHGRLRAAWRPHLENSRAAILDAARGCPGRDVALVAGSGALLDIPIEALSALFGQVVLADVVHPLCARWRVRGLSNVRFATVDLTGVLHRLDGLVPGDALGGSAGGGALAADFTVSANIASQLPLLPCRALAARGWSARRREEFSRAVVAAHFEWLRSRAGVWCLLADTAWVTAGRRFDPLYGLALPGAWRRWEWRIAPRPEIFPDRDVFHEVGAWSGRGGLPI